MADSGLAEGGLLQFRQEVRKSFMPLDFWCPRGTTGSCLSTFDTRALGALRLTEVTASNCFPFIGEQTRSQIEREYPDQFVLLISRKGSARHMQLGRSGITMPGKMILIHGRTPYRVETETDMASLFINIPAALLRTTIGTPENYCMIPMNSGQGLNGLFCEFLRSIWHKLDELGDEQRSFLAKEFLNFLEAALHSIQGQVPAADEPSVEDQHFTQALRFIDANLADFSLGVRQIAGALRLSHGRLHAIARGKGTSIGHTIRERRLERCRQTLSDPRYGHRSITQVALDWGFKNSAHFSQAFREQFGVSPRAFRKSHLRVE